jgi:hypothetical protein
MSEEKAIEELFYWQYSNTGSFKNQLFSLFMKADRDNKTRLAVCFPDEAKAFCLWYMYDGNQMDFFEKHIPHIVEKWRKDVQ